MNKKGFTLIELLSVIIVLALILIIAVPRILNVVEETEKETFRITGESLVKQARDKHILELTADQESKTYTIEEGAFVGESLPMSGKLPNNGIIEVDEEGNVYLEIRNEKYCAKKDFNSKQIIVTTDIENCRIVLPLTNDCFETANISETEVEITGYNSDCPVDVIIPSEISGKTVVGIGSDAFSSEIYDGKGYHFTSNSLLAYNNDIVRKNPIKKYKEVAVALPNYRIPIKSVIIPNTVRYIGSQAFFVNKLTSITIPSSVTSIGDFAFSNNQLTSVTLPSSVTSIGDFAFDNNQLTNVVIPSSVTSIGYDVFAHNQLTSVTLPSSLTSIGDFAFYNNQLTSVTIPSSVTSIGGSAFNNNQLPDNQAFIYARKTDGSEDKTNIVSYGGAKRDNIIIPSSVTNIGSGAFSNNQLTSVTLPSSVTSIGDFAFDNNQLTSVTLPSSVTSIGNGAFSRNNLNSVVIPQGVTSIEFDAFYDNQLTSVVIPPSVTISDYSISPSFYTSYVTNNNKVGGTYTAPSQNGVWTKQ